MQQALPTLPMRDQGRHGLSRRALVLRTRFRGRRDETRRDAHGHFRDPVLERRDRLHFEAEYAISPRGQLAAGNASREFPWLIC